MENLDDDRSVVEGAATVDQMALIADSYVRLTGTPLLAPLDVTQGEALWHAPKVIVAHGTEADPLFFYANAAALTLFEARAEEFIGMASRLSAEPVARAERQALLDRVGRDGFIDDYSGVRISLTGERFQIERAVVWNLIDEAGAIHGQAAAFDRWHPLP